MSTPGVSVVTPVRGRVIELRAMLESLRVAAQCCPEPVEVLVVDDSSPADADAHRASCSRLGAHYIAGPRHVGAKRNLGVELAAHDLILFLDSDCRASPDLLARYVRGLRETPAEVAALAGPTIIEPGEGRVYRIMSRSALLNDDLERPLTRQQVAWATTCNLAVRRAAFREVGGFVTRSLGPLGGEDVDFGLRLTARGYTIGCDPKAVVTHAAMSAGSLPNVLYRLYTYGRSEQWLTTRYPAQRQFRFNRISTIGAVGLVAAALAPRTRHAAALVPLVAGALLLRDAGKGYRAGQAGEALACALVEWTFDVGAVAGAVRLRRPDLLFAGFRPVDDDDPPRDGR